MLGEAYFLHCYHEWYWIKSRLLYHVLECYIRGMQPDVRLPPNPSQWLGMAIWKAHFLYLEQSKTIFEAVTTSLIAQASGTRATNNIQVTLYPTAFNNCQAPLFGGDLLWSLQIVLLASPVVYNCYGVFTFFLESIRFWPHTLFVISSDLHGQSTIINGGDLWRQPNFYSNTR